MSATFSYAQAAKGVSGTAVPSKTVSTEPEKSEPKTEEPSESAPVRTESVTTASEAETPREPETSTTSVDDDAEFTTVTNKHAHRSKAHHSRTSSPSIRSNAAQSKEGDASNSTNGTADASSEKQAQSDAKADKSENGSENPKEKSEKSDKSEKPAPPKELKAAPIPAVNIWQQRKEAQEAKAKAAPAPVIVKGKSEEGQQESGKASSKKKGADSASESTKGKKSDGKGRDEAMPPVADASYWPTPEVALGEEKKKAQEKTDKPERTDKSPTARSHGKEKWMPVNYVPTAVFNTPLPTTSGRGGRRAARGGRDSGRGGAHGTGAAAGEKANSGQATQGSATKQQTAGERGRNETGGGRAASLPAQSRRSTSADAANQDSRKGQAADRGRGGRGAEDTTTNGKPVNGGEHFSRPQRDGKHFPKNQDIRTGDRNPKNAHLNVDSQAAARANDRRVESGSKSADVHRDSVGFQDFNRERPDFRAERGGRNANRGRGGYSNFGQNPQFGMANNFVPGKFGFNDRQRSQPGVQTGQQQNNRMSMRSPSLPAPGMYNNVYPFPAEINTMYPPYPNVAPGPMSAVPYQQYVEPFGLMNMLSMQLEYYFSVDNMCKDMFLRRHMDAQGFVPLAVIASFKRVKSLTEDFEMLRHVARGLRHVDYQIGEDGVDRLRPKEGWAQWVLPVDQRDPSAQNEGAPAANHASKNNENIPFNGHVDSAPNGSIHNAPRQSVPNGTVSRTSPTPLSSMAPEFQPAQNEIPNVGLPKEHSSLSGGSPHLPCSPISPVDNPSIDNHRSARGLGSPPTKPSPSSRSVNERSSWSYDVDERRRSSSSSVACSTDIRLPKKGNRPYRPKGARYHDTKSFTSRNPSSEISHFYPPRGEPSATNYGFEMGPPYHTWSQYLIRNFDPQLYNEFRRLALDDLFTRHIDYGFNALMGYYQASLHSPTSAPEQVLADIVHLSEDSISKLRTSIFELLCSAMASGTMEDTNRRRVGFYYNQVYGHRQQAWRNFFA